MILCSTILEFSIDDLLYSLIWWIALLVALSYTIPKVLDAIIIFIENKRKYNQNNTKEKQALENAKAEYIKQKQSIEENRTKIQEQEKILKFLIDNDETNKNNYINKLLEIYKLNKNNSTPTE